MKWYVILVCLWFSVFALNAQRLVPIKDSLQYPVTNELSASQAEALFYNPGPYVIEVEDIDVFSVFGNLPFTVSDTAHVIQPGDTLKVEIEFLPEHNIQHDMYVVVKSNSGFGHQAIRVIGQGHYSNPYYDSTENKSEQQLKSAFRSKLGQGYNSLGYNSARDQMFMNIDNKKVNGQSAAVNTLECIYTGTTITGYADRQAAQNGNPPFNTEHTFPQGKFNSNEPMKSDLHHLYPTTNTSNSQRGNDPFGSIANPTWMQGGSKSGAGVFEPRDAQKGATARSMMYFVLRYQDYGNFFQGQESVLRSWHNTFAPTSIEKKRNDDIYSLQNNRNPFVDYPQFIERMPSLVTSASPAVIEKLYHSDDTIKLASANGRHVFNYVIYNDGNKVLSLSNFSLSDTSLHFVSATGAMSLQPQELVTIPVSFDGARVYTASMHYMTNVAGQVNMSVPIMSGAQPVVSDPEFTHLSLDVFPNPADEVLYITTYEKINKVELVDLLGKTRVNRQTLLQNKLDVSGVADGMYVLIVETSGRSIYKRVLIKH